jgi:hypothetical protein
MKSKLTLLLFLFLYFFYPTNAQNCLLPGNLVAGKGTAMFLKTMSPNRIVAGGIYFTSTQGIMTMASDTLHPRNGDVLTVFAALLDSNLTLVRLFNVIGFTETGGSFNVTRIYDMHADSAGNIYFSGAYTQDTLISYFGDTLVSDSYQEAFIIRCDTMGNTNLFKSCGTRNGVYRYEDQAHSITSDPHGNIIFTVSGDGSYFTINGDTANATQNVGLNGYSDIYIVSLHPNGSTRWIRNCGTPFKDDVAFDVDANAHGEVSVCGSVSGSNTVFHFGQISYTFRYSQYGYQGFVGKLDSSGVPIWFSPIEVYYPSGPDIGAYATAIDDSGYVYSSGYFDAWAIFNGDTIRTPYYTSNYFSKYNLNGQTEFVKLGNIDTFYPYPIYMDERNGKIIISGQTFTNQLTFQQYGQCCSSEAYVVVYSNQGEVLWLRAAKSVNSSNPYFGMGCLNDNGTGYICGTGGGGIVEMSPLQIPTSSSKQYYIVKFNAAPSNGLFLSLTNNGTDTVSCGLTTLLVPVLSPTSGPRVTWWANNDTISTPNFTVNLNASPKITTQYIATAFYNGCVVSDSIVLYVAPLPCSAGPDTSICQGQALSLNGNSLSGATYQWVPSSAVSNSTTAQTQFTASQSSNMVFKISRFGCSNTDTVTILVTPQTQSAFGFTNSLLNVTFSNSSLNFDSLYWDFGDSTAFSTATNPIHTYAQNGIYNVCLYTFNTCGVDTFCLSLNLNTVGIEPIKNTVSVKQILNGYSLSLTKQIGAFSLVDSSGRKVKSGIENGNSLNIDFSSFTKGFYLFVFENETTQKPIKLIW